MTSPSHRIGVCSWSLRPDSPAELVAALRRLGIDGVQLALSPMVHEARMWREAVATLREAGIDILSGMMAMAGEDYSTLQSIARTGGVRPDATWDANQRHARAVAALASHERIRLITFHAGFIPHDRGDAERHKIIERLRLVADVFADVGVALALETGQETAATLSRALDDLNCDNVGVNFDPANMILYGIGDPVESLRALAPRVRQIHVKDALPSERAGAWGSEVVAGTGAVKWREFFDIALRIQPAVNFVIEREAGPDRERDIAAARDLIRRYF